MPELNRPVFKFSGKSVLITGGTSGMGAAAAEAFAGSGARVMIAGRDQARASRLLDRMRAAGAQAHFVPGDISDADNCRRLLAETTSLIGPPDIVVNSAGIIYHATAEETSDSARFITGYPLVADGGSRA